MRTQPVGPAFFPVIVFGSTFGHVCGVIDDGADEETAAEVVFGVGTDFELKDDSSKIVGGRVDVP